MVADALGNPIRFELTGGEASDCKQASTLLKDLPFEGLLADRAYDSNAIVAFVEQRQAQVVIPPMPHRKVQRPYDKYLYKERNLVERFFNKLKHYRRLATRYEKTARNFLAMLTLVATIIWMS